MFDDNKNIWLKLLILIVNELNKELNNECLIHEDKSYVFKLNLKNSLFELFK